MISVNRRALQIVRQMVADSEALGLKIAELSNGATIIDAGIDAPGSLEAGRLFACACLGGLGQVSFVQQVFPIQKSGSIHEFFLPAVAVTVNQPHIACMGSQYAGWAVKFEGYFAIGSGPARALYAEEDIFRKISYQDHCEAAILMLEGKKIPDKEVTAWIAEKCRVRPENLTILIAPTASIVGSVQIASRSAETGLHKLAELGFDVSCVSSAFGLCPLAPVASDDLRAIGRTNDAILYGAQVFYSVRAQDDQLADLIERIPSSSSLDYGTPFYDLFMRHHGDFYQIDRLLFSPAEIEINNLNSGRVFRAGRLNPSIIEASLLGS